jgi:hypothetical protein
MRKNLIPVLMLAVLIVVALLLFGAAPAQAQVDLSPGVARISLIHGDVSTQRGDSGDWSVAALNQPIVSGDKISTGERSRAEVQLDYANVLRLDGNSQANISGLSRTSMQVQLGRGLADFVVLKDSEADVEIDTPNVAVRPILREGIYRIEVNAAGDTRVIVRKGEAQISTPQGSTRVRKGELATIRGSGSETEYNIADAPPKDAFDSWNNDRDHVIQNARSWGYTNRYYTGAEDLDAYGRWETVPDYGPVWIPAVQAGWAPYRLGRWVWEPYWGWTWVSYEPWGWAPYHYGRWFMYGASWVWWPGPVYRHYRPVWAPAYVSFFGFGGGFGVSVGFGFGSVGWLPIGPCDRYYPWWGSYRAHFNVVSINNIYNYRGGRGFDGWGPLHRGEGYSNLRLAMHDPRMREAVSYVPGDRFGTGRVAPRAPERDMFHNAHVMTGNLPVVPTRAALSVTDRQAERFGPAGHERFYTRGRPSAAPEPFAREASQVQEAIQRNGRFTPIRAGEGRPGSPAEAAGRPSGGERVDGRDVPRREVRSPEVGRPAGAISTPERAREMNTEPAGGRDWRRFGGEVAQNQGSNAPETRRQQNSSAPAGPRRVAPPAEREQRAPAAQPQQPRTDSGGWRRFSDREASPRNDRPAPNDRGAMNDRPAAATPQSAPDSQNWRQFRREARPNAAETPAAAPRDQWRRFPAESRQPEAVRQDRAPQYRAPREERPPLDLRQPIVRPRAERPSGGGQRNEPSRGGQAGGRSGGGNRTAAKPSGERHR